jgi:hypothetical protein
MAATTNSMVERRKKRVRWERNGKLKTNRKERSTEQRRPEPNRSDDRGNMHQSQTSEVKLEKIFRKMYRIPGAKGLVGGGSCLPSRRWISKRTIKLVKLQTAHLTYSSPKKTPHTLTFLFFY